MRDRTGELIEPRADEPPDPLCGLPPGVWPRLLFHAAVKPSPRFGHVYLRGEEMPAMAAARRLGLVPARGTAA